MHSALLVLTKYALALGAPHTGGPHVRPVIPRQAPGALLCHGPSDAGRAAVGAREPSQRTRSIPRLLGYATVGAGVTAAGYVGLVTGACPVDLGIGRRVRPLGPQLVDMAAPREVVFDVIAEPYLGRAPRRWPTSSGCWNAAATWSWPPISPPRRAAGPGRPDGGDGPVHPPERVDFRLVRGPVPHVVEAFVLTEQAGGAGTRLAYDGEIGADLWLLGQRWCELVAGRWEQTVAASLAGVKAEAERRAVECRGTPALQPRQSAPTHRLTAGTADPSTPRMPCS